MIVYYIPVNLYILKNTLLLLIYSMNSHELGIEFRS